MSAVLEVFAKEFRENLRERRTVIAALLFGPVFIPLLFAASLLLMIRHTFPASDAPVALAVAHAERAPNLVAQLREHGLSITEVTAEDASARAAVLAHRHALVLLVPADYGRRLAAGEPAPVLLYADSSDSSTQHDLARVRAALARYNAVVSRLRLMARGIDPLVLSAVAPQEVDVSTPASRSVLVLGMLSYLVLLTMLMGGFDLAIDATAGERERGSLEPLLTLPVPRERLMYGKVLAAGAFMLLSLTLTVTGLAIVLRFVGLERLGMSVNFGPATALAAIACCAPLVPLGAALMTIVAAFTRSYREAQTYLGFVLLVPTLPLVFAGAMGLKPTTALMAVPSLSQHFLIMSLLRSEPLPAGEIALSVGVTLALGALLVAAAGRLYRREALLG